MQRKELSGVERLDWLRLSRTENVGPVTFYKLLERYGSAGKALEALPDLARRGGRKKPLKAFPLSEARAEMEKLENLKARLIAACEPEYPAALAAVEDAPPVISVLGHVQLLQKRSVAIVGARNASLNGKKIAEKLARDLGDAGYTVISGLARGIDTAAHVGALNTGTAAVVAGGLDVVYPRENTLLYNEIRDRGAVIAENAPGTQPRAQHFPRRNRIVSGLSLGIIVVEAAPRSGSLITARFAADQGREVFAVPGSPLDPRAQGANNLIRNGAALVETVRDVLDVVETLHRIPVSEPAQRDFFAAPPAAEDDVLEMETQEIREKLLEFLSPVPAEVDEIIRACHVSTSAVLTALLELELAGYLQRHPGNRVSRAGSTDEGTLKQHA